VVTTIRIQGSLSDFNDSAIVDVWRTSIANAAGVSKRHVSVSVTAGSVVVTASIEISHEASVEDVVASLKNAMGSAASASSLLAVPVLEAPVITWSIPNPAPAAPPLIGAPPGTPSVGVEGFGNGPRGDMLDLAMVLGVSLGGATAVCLGLFACFGLMRRAREQRRARSKGDSIHVRQLGPRRTSCHDPQLSQVTYVRGGWRAGRAVSQTVDTRSQVALEPSNLVLWRRMKDELDPRSSMHASQSQPPAKPPSALPPSANASSCSSKRVFGVVGTWLTSSISLEPTTTQTVNVASSLDAGSSLDMTAMTHTLDDPLEPIYQREVTPAVIKSVRTAGRSGSKPELMRRHSSHGSSPNNRGGRSPGCGMASPSRVVPIDMVVNAAGHAPELLWRQSTSGLYVDRPSPGRQRQRVHESVPSSVRSPSRSGGVRVVPIDVTHASQPLEELGRRISSREAVALRVDRSIPEATIPGASTLPSTGPMQAEHASLSDVVLGNRTNDAIHTVNSEGRRSEVAAASPAQWQQGPGRPFGLRNWLGETSRSHDISFTPSHSTANL